MRPGVTAAALTLTAALLLPGCLDAAPAPRTIEGPTDGYVPTPAYLKVYVRTNDSGLVLADFNRTEWYVAGIAKRLDDHQLKFLGVHGKVRLLGEVVVEDVLLPTDMPDMRFASMHVSDDEKRRMDLEYDEILARLGVADEAVPSPETPPVVPTLLRAP